MWHWYLWWSVPLTRDSILLCGVTKVFIKLLRYKYENLFGRGFDIDCNYCFYPRGTSIINKCSPVHCKFAASSFFAVGLRYYSQGEAAHDSPSLTSNKPVLSTPVASWRQSNVPAPFPDTFKNVTRQFFNNLVPLKARK